MTAVILGIGILIGLALGIAGMAGYEVAVDLRRGSDELLKHKYTRGGVA